MAVTGDRISGGRPRPASSTPDAGDRGGRPRRARRWRPGFIDIHTHYDAQILWDGDLTPSSWHGVTSVVMGNCGFGVAPTLPEHRDTIVRTLENVEGMSMEALEEGIDWCFETFPEYLDAIDERPKRLNVGAFVGHSPLRLFVLGGEERPATDDEVATMRGLLREAMRGRRHRLLDVAPARTTRARTAGRCRAASPRSTRSTRSTVGAGRGWARASLEVSIGPGLFVDQFSELAVQYGVPVTWTALVARADKPGAALRTVERGAALPGEVYPQIACRPIVMQIGHGRPHARSARSTSGRRCSPCPRDERADLYRDASWRDRARPTTLEAWSPPLVEDRASRRRTRTATLVGVPLDELAAERGTTPFDLMLDLALADELATRFRVVMDNDGDDEIGELLADKRTLLGLSDAGAHASQLCDACYSTHLLGHWVRERKALSLEDAVWRLTGHPHQAFRIPERGPGAGGLLRRPRRLRSRHRRHARPSSGSHDQPGGADRLVVRSTGVEHMWVNGVADPRRAARTSPASPPAGCSAADDASSRARNRRRYDASATARVCVDVLRSTMTVTDLYYDPYDYAIDAESVSGVEAAARRGAGLLERAARVLRAEPLRRRAQRAARHRHVPVGSRDRAGDDRATSPTRTSR